MKKVEKVLFTGKTHTTAARGGGPAQRDHGKLDIRLSSGGSAEEEEVFEAVQPHPTAERLFAGAWSACYSAALGFVAGQMKVGLPADLSVDIEVDLGQTGSAWLLQARLNVHAPGMEREVAERIAHGAHEVCPYSKATRGNIDVAINVITR